LERLKSLHRDKSVGDYWAWQGDGTDNLQSLVCPVLIPAKDLEAILDKRNRLLAACRTSLGAFEALALVGADRHLPGYRACLGELKRAIAAAEAKCQT
jgi:hypothetical protein